MPTRIVTLTQQDVTRLNGLTYIALHRQPVLLPTRLADLVGQLGESSSARRRPLGSGRAGSPWLFPGAYPGAHQGAGYLGTSLNEQLGLQIRPGRGAALCDLADELPAAVLAALLGISVDTAGRWAALVKRDWAGYIAERDGQPLGPEQTYQIRAVGHPCAVRWSARITPSRVLRLPPPHRASSRAGVMGISSQVLRSSPTRANFSAEGSACGTGRTGDWVRASPQAVSAWRRRHADLIALDELDAGYRLVVTALDPLSPGHGPAPGQRSDPERQLHGIRSTR